MSKLDGDVKFHRVEHHSRGSSTKAAKLPARKTSGPLGAVFSKHSLDFLALLTRKKGLCSGSANKSAMPLRRSNLGCLGTNYEHSLGKTYDN